MSRFLGFLADIASILVLLAMLAVLVVIILPIGLMGAAADFLLRRIDERYSSEGGTK